MTLRTFNVRVSKTIQVKKYEQLTVELSSGGECESDDLDVERKEVYETLKAEMADIF